MANPQQEFKMVNCESCAMAFRIPVAKLTQEQTKVKCSKCSYIFIVHRGNAPDPFSDKSTLDLVSISESSEQTGPITSPGIELDALEELHKKTPPKNKNAFAVHPKATPTSAKFAHKELELSTGKRDRALRIALICLTFFTGILLGTYLNAKTLNLNEIIHRIRFGIPLNFSNDIQVTEFQGWKEFTPLKQVRFHVSGKVYNQGSKEHYRVPLKVIFYSEKGEFIFNESFICCIPLPAHKTSEFQNSFIIDTYSQLEKASYKVALKDE